MAKNEVIKFRCTTPEKKMLEAAAVKHKLTLSEWFLAIGKQHTAGLKLEDEYWNPAKAYAGPPAKKKPSKAKIRTTAKGLKQRIAHAVAKKKASVATKPVSKPVATKGNEKPKSFWSNLKKR